MSDGISRRSMLRGAGALALAGAGGFAGRGIVSATPAATTPPRMVVTRHEPGTSPGQIFFTFDNGAEIAAADGTPLWTVTGPDAHANFQLQTYRGRRVLTWWQGNGDADNGETAGGIDVVTSLDHAPVATVGTSGRFRPDVHEFRITPSNTALITAYVPVPRDLSVVGGPANGQVLDSYCLEVDIASGAVLRSWSALDHVPLTDSFQPVPTTPDQPYDYLHINSISITPDDHLLICARNTSALYKVHRTTGEILWTLGGRSSSFSVAPDAVFGFQHHAIFEQPNTIRLFDNGSNGRTTLHPTRIAWLRINTTTMAASLTQAMSIPGIQAFAMGSAQRLPNGNVFVSWGSVPRLSELSPNGDLLFDATLTIPSYRAFKYLASS